MEGKRFKIITFPEDGMSLDVRFDAAKETVWLTQAVRPELFRVDRTRITRHKDSIVKDGKVAMGSNVRKTHFANSAIRPPLRKAQ